MGKMSIDRVAIVLTVCEDSFSKTQGFGVKILYQPVGR